MAVDAQKIFPGFPSGLRDALINSYNEIANNYAEHRWEPSELNAGKFCEVVYTIVRGTLDGSLPAKPTKPKDMVKACRLLETAPSNPVRIGDRSLRILIPRVLMPLYEIRNNRGVGHVGGDVDPNYLDATAAYGMASWVLAELVRIFHNISTRDAQETVDALIERKHPLIWEIEDVKRVLEVSMSSMDQTLLLLHQEPAWVSDQDLARWIEYSSVSMYRKRILEPLHKMRLIEFDRKELRAHISPLGTQKVERDILKLKK